MVLSVCTVSPVVSVLASETVTKYAELGWRIDWQANTPSFRGPLNPQTFAIGPNGSNAPFDRRRIGYLMYDISEYKNNLSALNSINFRIMTHEAEVNNKRCFQAYLLTPDQVEGILDFDVAAKNGMTYAEAVKLGIAQTGVSEKLTVSESDFRMLISAKNTPNGTMYTSDNLVDNFTQYYEKYPTASGIIVVKIDVGDVTLGINAAMSMRGNTWNLNASGNINQVPAFIIETKAPENIMKAGHAIGEQLPVFTANNSVSLPAVLSGFPSVTIEWESLNSDIITDTGVITRPEFYDTDEAVKLKAIVKSGGEEWGFFYNISVLRQGSFTESGSVDGNAVKIDFDTFSPASEAAGHILQIPNTYLKIGKEYIISDSEKNEITRFFASVNSSYSYVDVSDYVGNTTFFLSDSEDTLIKVKDDMFILRGIDLAEKSAINILDTLDLGDLSGITHDITLPKEMGSVNLTWNSSAPSYLSDKGRVDPPLKSEGDKVVSLTAECTVGGITYSRTFSVKILCSGGSGYPELKDPMHMSDEAFFGKWDSSQNAWAMVFNSTFGQNTNVPSLKYDLYPELKNVEKYVKEGNYAKAKEALLTYYRGRNEKISWVLPQTSHTDMANYLRTEMINEKIYSFLEGGDPVGLVEIDDELGWHTVDLRLNGSASFIKEAINLIDSNMDGSTAEIYSRRYGSGEFTPYLDVMENGSSVRLYAIQDTYIKAGSYEQRNTNYGNSEMLYCREEADLSDPARPISVSASTARPYLRFDTSKLTGNISSMKLNFYGKSSSIRQKIFVFSTPQEVGFNEKELTWIWRANNVRHFTYIFNNKKTGWMFNMEKSSQNTGAPPNSVNSGALQTSGSYYASQDYRSWNTTYEWINYNSRGYPLEWLISRYRLTDNEQYAYSALEFLMSLYTQSGYRTTDPYTSGEFAPQGTAYARKLEGAWRTEYLCHTFFGTLYSDLMTPELLTAQLKYANAHLEYFLYARPTTAGNQNSAHRIGALRMQAYFPEMSTKSHWDLAKERLKEHYIDGMTVSSTSLLPMANPDGSYTESTSGYMDGTVRELVQCLDMLKAYDGMEDPYYKLFMETYESIMEYMLNLSFPYGMSPGWGDASRGGTKSFLNSMLQSFENPWLRFFVSGGSMGTEPPYTSKVFKDNGTVFLKDGWSSSSMGAFSNYIRGGSHSHSDALTLDVSAYGVPLLVDGGNSSYSASDPMARSAAKALTHNVVEITNYNRQYHANNAPGGDQEGNSNVRSDTQRADASLNSMFDFVVMGSGPGPMKNPDGSNKSGSGAIYTGYDVNRKVLFLHNKYWIVSDYIIPQNSTQQNTYSQAWHPNANENGQRGSADDIDTAWTSWLYPGFDMAEPINKITIAQGTKAMTTHLNGPNIQVVPADPEKLVEKKLQYYQSTPRYGAVISNYVSYRQENVSGPVTYDTVLYPEKTGERANITVKRINMQGVPKETATAIEIGLNLNTGYYYTSNEATPATRSFGDFTTNGEMVYVETDANDKLTMATLTKAASLKKGSATLVSSTETIKDLGIRWNGSTLDLSSENGTVPLSGVNIYSPVTISTVKLNGEEVNFTFAGNMVTTSGQPYTPPPIDGPKPGSPGGMGNASGGGSSNPLSVLPVAPKEEDDDSKDDSDITEFLDISEHWAKNEITKLQKLGKINGDPDGNFRPDDSITRAEFVAILARALELENKETDVSFTDVSEDDWFFDAVYSAANAGIINGYGDGSFAPYNTIKRQEIAKILMSATKYLGISDEAAINADIFDYADYSAVEDWAKEAVSYVTALKLMQGMEGNNFEPLSSANRAQAVVVTIRLLDLTASDD